MKFSLESNLGPNLMLSWLMILNFRVKIAKLTPFGQPRTAKWALGGPQERSKRAKMGGLPVLGCEVVAELDRWGVSPLPVGRTPRVWSGLVSAGLRGFYFRILDDLKD